LLNFHSTLLSSYITIKNLLWPQSSSMPSFRFSHFTRYK
jgi:hypothetical protein